MLHHVISLIHLMNVIYVSLYVLHKLILLSYSNYHEKTDASFIDTLVHFLMSDNCMLHGLVWVFQVNTLHHSIFSNKTFIYASSPQTIVKLYIKT